MKVRICPAFYQAAAGGVMARGIFSWHTSGPSVATDCRLDTLMTSTPLYDHEEPSSDGEQRNRTPRIVWSCFLEHDEFIFAESSQKSPSLDPVCRNMASTSQKCSQQNRVMLSILKCQQGCLSDSLKLWHKWSRRIKWLQWWKTFLFYSESKRIVFKNSQSHRLSQAQRA